MKSSHNIEELAKALASMQGAMNPAKKDKKNPFFKTSYADLTSMWNAIREPLSENGLSIVQDALTIDVGVSIITRIIHVSGQWIEFGPLHVPVDKNNPQAVGSAVSYAKRYTLGAAVGIVAEDDDDGNCAQNSQKKKEEIRNVIQQKKYPKVNIEDWYEEKSKIFNKIEVIKFVQHTSNLMDKNEQEMVNFLASFPEDKFAIKFETWKNQQ